MSTTITTNGGPTEATADLAAGYHVLLLASRRLNTCTHVLLTLQEDAAAKMNAILTPVVCLLTGMLLSTSFDRSESTGASPGAGDFAITLDATIIPLDSEAPAHPATVALPQ